MQKQHKGTTVVEVVIAFAMISMSFAIGMIGIASGANFINSGARLKNQQRKEAVADLDGEGAAVTDEIITVTGKDGASQTFTVPVQVQKRSADGFVKYCPKS